MGSRRRPVTALFASTSLGKEKEQIKSGQKASSKGSRCRASAVARPRLEPEIRPRRRDSHRKGILQTAKLSSGASEPENIAEHDCARVLVRPVR